MNTATLETSIWSVGRGQHVQLVRRGLRRHIVEATVLSGTLVATDDLSESEFVLVIALPEAMDRPITISSSSARSMTLGSHGVFQQRGRPPSFWLTMTAELDLPDIRQLTGHGEVTVRADLNLNPSVETH
jgi:hypothetical protein